MALRFTLRQLEYFVAVGDAGSIALASQVVNVSSPSISAAISQLEAEFGVQLFVRQHAQGLTLTPGGQRIFNAAKRLLDNGAALNDLANDIVEKARGPLNFGCLVTLAPLISAALRRSFEARYPDAQVTLFEAHQARLLDMLRRAEIDVAITYDMEIPKDVVFEPLAVLPPYVMLARTHPLAQRDSVTLEDIAGEPLVLLDLPLSREYFLSIFHASGLRPVIAERTAEQPVQRSLVAHGYGYGLINLRTLTDQAPDGTPLAFVRLEGDHPPLSMGLATVRAAHRSRVLLAFEEHARDRIGAGDIPGILRNGH